MTAAEASRIVSEAGDRSYFHAIRYRNPEAWKYIQSMPGSTILEKWNVYKAEQRRVKHALAELLIRLDAEGRRGWLAAKLVEAGVIRHTTQACGPLDLIAFGGEDGFASHRSFVKAKRILEVANGRV